MNPASSINRGLSSSSNRWDDFWRFPSFEGRIKLEEKRNRKCCQGFYKSRRGDEKMENGDPMEYEEEESGSLDRDG